MSDPIWKSIRVTILGTTLIGGLLVLGKTIATPKATKAPSQTSALPATVPLAGWQTIAAAPIRSSSTTVGQQYQYRQGRTLLTVELRQEVGDGNVSRFLFVHTPIRGANANLQIKYQAGTGFYGVLVHDGMAYLSACMNARGESTVTEYQFTQNLYRHSLKPVRILPWLLGGEPLLDRRCLWTLMSVPTNPKLLSSSSTSNGGTLRKLEGAWSTWYQWWQANFPPLPPK